MARRKKKKQDRYEYYYCQIEEWSRSYRVGVNRCPWELDPERYSEWNTIIVSGTIRHIRAVSGGHGVTGSGVTGYRCMGVTRN